MKSLVRMINIAKKEFLEAISTPLLFLAATFFIFLTSYFFYAAVNYYSQISSEWLIHPAMQKEFLEPSSVLLPPLFANYSMLLLFFIPLLTMSSIANERRNGTLELLYTFPIRDNEIILGKWIGTLLILAVLLVPLWTYPFLYKFFGGTLAISNYGAAFLGLLFLAFLFSAIGIFISSLSESQTVSAIATIGILLLLWMLENTTPMLAKEAGSVMMRFSIQKYFQPFTNGLVSTEAILFFVLTTALFLFLGCRSLEKRFFRNPL